MTKLSPFYFKQFKISQHPHVMKVGTDGILLGAWVNLVNNDNVLDIGTGTGLIAIMLAQRNHSIKVVGVEIDEKAAKKSRENMTSSPWKERLSIYNMSIQEYAQNTEHSYDLIVSNPPFFSGGTFSYDENRNQVRHTVKLSHSDLLRSVRQLLTNDGRFALILPYLEGLRFIEIAEDYGLYCTIKTDVIPKKGKQIERLMIEFQKNKTECKEYELTILDSDGKFTDEYMRLTDAFYLNLK